MKKGVTTLDAITAFLILLFIAIFIQKTATVSLSNSDDYGLLVQSKLSSSHMSSIINTFYSTNPGENDKVKLASDEFSAIFFGDETASLEITKFPESNETRTITSAVGKTFSSSSPAVKGITLNQQDKEVRKN